MKRLSSKPPVKTIKRAAKGVVNEPFERFEVEEFKPVNKTRKIHYPMMLKKYQIERMEDANMDDFRHAMSIIVAGDNDDLFDRYLAKNSVRGSQTGLHADQEASKHGARPTRRLSSISIDSLPQDRTSPKKIFPHSFFNNSQASSLADTSAHQEGSSSLFVARKLQKPRNRVDLLEAAGRATAPAQDV